MITPTPEFRKKAEQIAALSLSRIDWDAFVDATEIVGGIDDSDLMGLYRMVRDRVRVKAVQS